METPQDPGQEPETTQDPGETQPDPGDTPEGGEQAAAPASPEAPGDGFGQPQPTEAPEGEQEAESPEAEASGEADPDAPVAGGPIDPASGQVHGGSSDAPVAPQE